MKTISLPLGTWVAKSRNPDLADIPHRFPPQFISQVVLSSQLWKLIQTEDSLSSHFKSYCRTYFLYFLAGTLKVYCYTLRKWRDAIQK